MIMSELFLLLPILLPLLGGAVIWFVRMKPAVRNFTVELFVILNAAASWLLILRRPDGALPLFSFGDTMPIRLHLDGLGCFFLGMASTLWVFVAIYAFSYMKDEEHTHMFFTFFVLSLAATDGIALAGNLISLYFFYEMLTIFTIPLVMHGCRKIDMHAGRVYAAYQLGGAAFAFVGIVYLVSNFGGGDFSLGGFVGGNGDRFMLEIIYLLMFLGFGVKACVFPLHRWLPTASVAPTPVTALLHAAAVVKAGIFAIMRLSYYTFEPEFLRASTVGKAALLLACFTAVYAAVRAVRERHFKRRLAYSTVSNLSYILVGVLMFTEAGLAAGLCHMLFHAVIKMNAFLSCGAFMKTGRSRLEELDGVGYKMPVTFACYTVSALALAGIPPLSGFISKWMLLSASANAGSVFGIVGAAALVISSLLAAVYMITPSVRAYFPARGVRGDAASDTADIHEAPLKMTAVMAIFAAAVVLLGIFASPVVSLCGSIAAGSF